MSMYLKIPNVNGNVTTKGYEGWSEIGSLQFGVVRPIRQTVGEITNREGGSPTIRKVELTKQIDKTSNKLLENSLTGSSLGNLDIHLCTTNQNLTPYVKYTLSNAIVSEYQEYVGRDQRPHERIVISFTALQKTYVSQNTMGKAESPQITGYNLETATLA